MPYTTAALMQRRTIPSDFTNPPRAPSNALPLSGGSAHTKKHKPAETVPRVEVRCSGLARRPDRMVWLDVESQKIDRPCKPVTTKAIPAPMGTTV